VIPSPTPVSPPPTGTELPGLTTVDATTWDETAVRKVLYTFAFGGQATDDQIQRWAALAPGSAIVEMLRWDEHNSQLSAPGPQDNDNLLAANNNLNALSARWSSASADNRMPDSRRASFSSSAWERAPTTWMQAVLSRGLNPFRERIGFWETNYHMAVHMGQVNPAQAVRYYDDIMQAHANGLPYQDVILNAALSSAVTRHYGNDQNVWANNKCYCNEDFGREFHQLFFGVLGAGDRDYHEYVTIKNTARALTDIRLVNRLNPAEPWAGDEVSFGTERHYPYPVDVLHVTYSGATAADQINAIGQAEIEHNESLDNLPLIIIRGLADDEIDAGEAAALRTAWRSMPRKDLLSFLRAYATSTLFHSPNRLHYQTSFDRHLTFANHYTQSNEEVYADSTQLWRLTWTEQESPFNPDHGVFGAQTGIDARDNAGIFRGNYNTMASYYLLWADGWSVKKDWALLAPRASDGSYPVALVAEWLWQRFVADGLKNFGPLERTYVYALLATGKDASSLAHPGTPEQPVTLAETQAPTLQTLLGTWGNSNLKLASTVTADRTEANVRVNQAISFIAATPFIFVQEGR
jgi:hypothetical protein